MKLKFITLILLCHLAACTHHIRWTAIGDSITYLNDHRDETGNRVTNGYLSLVCARYPNIEYINQGHNGWTTVGIAHEIENLGLIKSDLYSVLLGTNPSRPEPRDTPSHGSLRSHHLPSHKTPWNIATRKGSR